MATNHEDTVGYYENWPTLTKRDAEMAWAAVPEEDKAYPAIAAKEPRPNPIYTTTFDDDLLPEPDEYSPGISDEWRELSAIVEAVDVVEAYNRWIGKTWNGHGAQHRAGNAKIRCPMPDHEDKNPSASMKSETNEWVCHACNVGGGTYQLAAIRFGFDLHARGEEFKNLKLAMAEDLGWQSAGGPKDEPRMVKPGTIKPIVEALEEVPPPESTDDDVPQTFDWRELLPAGSPWWQWMTAWETSGFPQEFIFFGGAQLLALSTGRQVYVPDADPLMPVLYLLFCAPTGTGKSRSARQIIRTLREALPFERDAYEPMGVLIPGKPASGEAVYTALAPPTTNPDEDGKKMLSARRVKAFFYIDEFMHMAKHKARSSDTLEETLMELFDPPPIFEKIHANTGNNVVAEEPFACILSTQQPPTIHRYVQDLDVFSGGINRWLPVFMAQPWERSHHRVPPPNLDAVHAALRDREDWSRNGIALSYEEGVEDRWIEFVREAIDPLLVDDEDPMAAIWSRVESLLIKFQIIFAINERSGKITVEMLERVLKLWPYIKWSYQQMLGRIESSAKADRVDKAREAVRTAPLVEFDKERVAPAIKEAALKDKIFGKRKRSAQDTEEYNRIIDVLTPRGHPEIMFIDQQGPRGPKSRWVVWTGDND